MEGASPDYVVCSVGGRFYWMDIRKGTTRLVICCVELLCDGLSGSLPKACVIGGERWMRGGVDEVNLSVVV